MPLEVTLNGQQYTNSSATIAVYPQPHVSSLSPSSGPMAGGTAFRLYGAFSGGVHRLCRFAAPTAGGGGGGSPPPVVEVPASLSAEAHDALVCVSPPNASLHAAPAAALAVHVEVSLNGQQFSASNVAFGYYPRQRVSSVSPATGLMSGGTLVRVSGDHLFRTWESHCKFTAANFEHIVQSTYLSSGAAQCLSPATNGTSLLRSVLLDETFNQTTRLHGTAEYLSTLPRSASIGSATKHFTAGTIVIDVHEGKPRPIEFAARSFVLSFNLTVVHGPSTSPDLAAGDGLSISYGDFPHGIVSERGAGQGLRVQLLGFTNNRIDVYHMGRLLLSRPLRWLPLGSSGATSSEQPLVAKLSVSNAELSPRSAPPTAPRPRRRASLSTCRCLAGSRAAIGGWRSARARARRPRVTM